MSPTYSQLRLPPPSPGQVLHFLQARPNDTNDIRFSSDLQKIHLPSVVAKVAAPVTRPSSRNCRARTPTLSIST